MWQIKIKLIMIFFASWYDFTSSTLIQVIIEMFRGRRCSIKHSRHILISKYSHISCYLLHPHKLTTRKWNVGKSRWHKKPWYRSEFPFVTCAETFYISIASNHFCRSVNSWYSLKYFWYFLRMTRFRSWHAFHTKHWRSMTL